MGALIRDLWKKKDIFISIYNVYCKCPPTQRLELSDAFLQLFQVANALAPNTASLLIFRFLGGFFAAAPLSNAGGLLADMWDPKTRGKAVCLFGLAPFAGPTVRHAFTLIPSTSLTCSADRTARFWIYDCCRCSLALGFLATCDICRNLLPSDRLHDARNLRVSSPEIRFLNSSDHMDRPRLLVLMAEKKRKETGDSRYYAPLDKKHVQFSERMQNVLAKPFKMLFLEPMLLAVTIYMSVCDNAYIVQLELTQCPVYLRLPLPAL